MREQGIRKQHPADYSNENRSSQGQNHPYNGDSPGYFQIIGSPDCHEFHQNMGHAAITKSPGKRGNYRHKAIAARFPKKRHPVFNLLHSVFHLRLCHSKEIKKSRYGLCIGDEGRHPPCMLDAGHQYGNQSQNHQNTLHEIRSTFG